MYVWQQDLSICMYVHKHVCVYVHCMYVCMYGSMTLVYVCMYVWQQDLSICMYVNKHVCVYIHCMYVCMSTRP